ncbi:MAG: tetraacyldisaccharide 4'-kinase [Deltaproteobacteria bacterium]|nr:tetraacyldisaccharide 4'-kinase [Deltaproteobacteria bacterium]
MKLLLSPLAILYGAVTALRNACYDKGILRAHRSKLPVISIGNISVGGNAKTPLVIFLTQELSKRGMEVVILSRGYGGSLRGPVRVLPEHRSSEVGDEPLLIAAKTGRPVVISRDRVAGASFIEKEKLGNVILLDDGFQHRRLARDLDIVSAYVGSEDARRDFLEAKLLPLGRFREARDRALRRADVVIFSERQPISDTSAVDNRLLRVIPAGVQIYRSFFQVQGAFSLVDAAPLSAKSVVAFCGIANPEGFLETLSRSGYVVHQSHVFGDHHAFTTSELQSLRQKHPGLALICTEKDASRIPPDQRSGIYELRIATKVIPADAFVTHVCRLILQRQSRMQGTLVDLPNSRDVEKSSKQKL